MKMKNFYILFGFIKYLFYAVILVYLNIVQALGMEPLSLMGWGKAGEYTERFSFLVERRSQGEIEFVLHMVEQMLRGHDSYLKE